MVFKNRCRNHLKYGRKLVDFQDGSLICMAPGHLIELDSDAEGPEDMQGWGVFFHPDLIRAMSLNERMKSYTFFSYEITEALFLSEKERQILNDSVEKLQFELQENIDEHSQPIIVSTLEVLLNYCTRFYGRQFITRRSSGNGVVAQVEKILGGYFKDFGEKGLPTVKFFWRNR